MKIGDRVFVRGYIDEIRKDTVIVRNDGGYFGTVLSEVTGELPSAQTGITLESAIDYLHSIGWMQEHDRTLTESAQPEQKNGEWVLSYCGHCGAEMGTSE